MPDVSNANFAISQIKMYLRAGCIKAVQIRTVFMQLALSKLPAVILINSKIVCKHTKVLVH